MGFSYPVHATQENNSRPRNERLQQLSGTGTMRVEHAEIDRPPSDSSCSRHRSSLEAKNASPIASFLGLQQQLLAQRRSRRPLDHDSSASAPAGESPGAPSPA